MNFVIWFRANWERATGWSLLGVGGVALIFGAVQVAQAKYVVDQLSFLMSGGLLGLGCVALGSALLCAAVLHDEWRTLDGIEGALRENPSRQQEVSLGREPSGAAPLLRVNALEPVDADESVPMSSNGRSLGSLRSGRV